MIFRLQLPDRRLILNQKEFFCHYFAVSYDPRHSRGILLSIKNKRGPTALFLCFMPFLCFMFLCFHTRRQKRCPCAVCYCALLVARCPPSAAAHYSVRPVPGARCPVPAARCPVPAIRCRPPSAGWRRRVCLFWRKKIVSRKRDDFFHLLSFAKTIAAIHRTIVAGLERHLAGLPAFGAHRVVHRAGGHRVGEERTDAPGVVVLGVEHHAFATAQREHRLADLCGDVRTAVNTLAETAMHFAVSAKAGKFMAPVANAYPFLMLMGKVVMAWLLLWEAGVARGKLDGICAGKGIDPADARECSALAKEDAEAAFYTGKTTAARYFVRHVLPEVDAAAKAIRSEDFSMIEIPEEAFASS